MHPEALGYDGERHRVPRGDHYRGTDRFNMRWRRHVAPRRQSVVVLYQAGQEQA